MSDRVSRPCDICGQSDDHPRHQVLNIVTQEVQLGHFDCCAGQGCEVCKASLEQAPEGARNGAALVEHREALVAQLTKEGQA